MTTRAKPIFILTLAAAVALAITSSARADFSGLGTGLNYGVLTGPSIGNFQLSSDTFITGNVGVGSSNGMTNGTNNNIQFSGANLVGNLYLQGTNTNGIGGTASSITTQSAAVGTAYSSVSSFANTLASQVGTTIDSTTLTSLNSYTLQASNGALINGNNVFNVDTNTYNLDPSHTITINGTASQYVVINITGNNNFTFQESFNLGTGGITADHVLYNITGVGKSVQIAGNAHTGTINGIIVALNDKINLDNVTVDGRVFGGQTGQDSSLVSGFHLVQPNLPTPEPASGPRWRPGRRIRGVSPPPRRSSDRRVRLILASPQSRPSSIGRGRIWGRVRPFPIPGPPSGRGPRPFGVPVARGSRVEGTTIRRVEDSRPDVPPVVDQPDKT